MLVELLTENSQVVDTLVGVKAGNDPLQLAESILGDFVSIDLVDILAADDVAELVVSILVDIACIGLLVDFRAVDDVVELVVGILVNIVCIGLLVDSMFVDNLVELQTEVDLDETLTVIVLVNLGVMYAGRPEKILLVMAAGVVVVVVWNRKTLCESNFGSEYLAM